MARPRSVSLWVASLFFAYGCFFLQPVFSIFPDQAGKYDWLKQHVGGVELARFDRSKVYVATDLGVVASLDLESGNIGWRAVLDENAAPIVDMAVSKGVLVTVDSLGVVRAWSTRGAFLWDAALPTMARGLTFVTSGSGLAMVVAVCDDLVVSFAAKNGTKLWETSLDNRMKATGAFKLRDNKLIIPMFHRGTNRINVLQVAIEDGSISAEHQYIADTAGATALDPQSFRFLAHQDIGVVLTEDGRALCGISHSSSGSFQPKTKVPCTKVSSLSKTLEKATMLGNQQACSSDTILLRDGLTFLAVAALLNGDNVVLQPVAVASGHDAAALRCSATGKSEIVAGQSSAHGIDLIVKQITGKLSVNDDENSQPDFQRVHLANPLPSMDPSAKTPSSHLKTLFTAGPGHRGVLIQLKEETMLYVDELMGANNAAKWTRTEALSKIQDAMFWDLPNSVDVRSESQDVLSNEDGGRVHRLLHTHFLALKAQLGLATPEEVDAVKKYQAQNSDKLKATRDLYGFRKQIIVATSIGKIVSLHSGDGRVLWSLELQPGHVAIKLAPWEVSHDKGVARDRIVVFSRSIDTSNDANNDVVIATVICTKTGLLVDQFKVKIATSVDDNFEGLEIVHLPDPIHSADHTTTQHAFLILSSPHHSANRPMLATLLPNTPEVCKEFAKNIAPALVHWRVTPDRKRIQGIRFGSISQAETTVKNIQRGSQIKSTVVWEIAAPEGNTILAATGTDSTEPHSLAARPLPHGGILLKRDNANTILVVVGREKEDPADHQRGLSTVLTASLVDAPSGRILFSQQHEDATGPVHAVMSEQWAVYHYWNAAINRWQMASVDGYHVPPPDLTVMTLALSGKGGWRRPINDTSVALFERQVFHMKLPARVLAVTKTSHGTAAKMVLVGTPAGQVYQVDRRLLDPRRPRVAPGSKPTPAQVAEGLPPYAPEVAIVGPSYVTLDKRVARLTNVRCSPTQLESSTLCIAVGLDMFYSRLQPSRGFDMVPDDFPYALLVTIVAVMAVALIVAKETTRRRALKLKWQ